MKGKAFRRLRKKAGSILFVIVIVMAMLIALATGAYYTAYSARMTVVDNYNYSQLYLSASSISDMGISAVCNNTADTTYNLFSDFYDAVYALNVAGTDTITARSSNLTYNAAAGDYVYDGVSALPGIMDSYSITVKLLKTTSNYKYYSITAMANYHEDKIEIETLVYVETTPSGGAPVTFNQFFVSTGQGSNQMVRISVNEITDDAYFKNDVTYIASGVRSNMISGDLTSTGSIIFDGMVTTKPGVDKDWYINKDFIMADARVSLDLGAGSLYVGGDMVIGNDKGVTAGDIYVLGDLYLTCSTAALNCSNIYVAGNVYTTYDNTYSCVSTNSFTTNSLATDGKIKGNVILATDSIATNQTKSTVLSTLAANGTVENTANVVAALGTGLSYQSWAEETAKNTLNSHMDTTKYDVKSTSAPGSNVDITANEYAIDFSIIKNAYDADEGGNPTGWKLTNADGNGICVDPYGNYTIEILDNYSQAKGNIKNVVVHITGGNSTITDIVGVENSGIMNNDGTNVTYVIDVADQNGTTTDLKNSGDAVYIGLGANCAITTNPWGGTSYVYDADKNDTFNWAGKYDFRSVVVKKGASDDAVIFEMVDNNEGNGITRYTQKEKTFVTTESILGAMGYNIGDKISDSDYQNLKFSDFTTTDATGTKTLNIPGGDNNIYLFSSSHAGDGVALNDQNETFCGYIYAPYMDYTAADGNVGTAVFGGMIVNTYKLLGQRDYVYVHPDSTVLSDILEEMGTSTADIVRTKGWNSLGHNNVS